MILELEDTLGHLLKQERMTIRCQVCQGQWAITPTSVMIFGRKNLIEGEVDIKEPCPGSGILDPQEELVNAR